MRLGLGLSLTNVRGSGAAPIFDPATLTPSGRWKPTYTASPWVGQSGGNLAGGSAPTQAAAVDGAVGATFNGTTQNLASASAISSFLAAAQWGFAALVKATAVPADPGAGARNTARVLMSDSAASGYWGITLTATGPCAYVYDGAYKDVKAAATPLNNWIAIFAKLSGGTLSIAANDGAYATTAVTDIDVLTGVLTMGTGYGGTLFQGDVLEVLTRATAWTDQERSDLYSYLKATYPSAGLP